MLLNQIEIFGYKRFVKANAYVGRKAVALVGPNEAGKSTVLSALQLVENEAPVPEASYSRSLKPGVRDGDLPVVRLTYELTARQREILSTLPLQKKPTQFREIKYGDGNRRYSYVPSPSVSPAVVLKLASSWHLIAKEVLKGNPEQDLSGDQEQLRTDVAQVTSALQNGSGIDQQVWDRIGDAVSELEVETLSKTARAAFEKFTTFMEWASPDANVSARVHLLVGDPRPPFAFFSAEDRALRAQYSLDDSSADGSVALSNLLSVAGVTLDEIRTARADPPYLKHILEQATARLGAFFAARWSQEPVGVGLEVDGSILFVLVRDTGEESVGWLSIDDRSDGLRMFVALATFLAKENKSRPPILLIDEVEQHLHLNAQADLVQMLTGLSQIQQVIYTTHSPGCLPGDIGSGVRFVEPDSAGNSTIRHDFWSMQNHNHVGFNPLLLVMGAGAAAFSGLRYALFVEGASDMLLLPTLLRLAGCQQPIPYQVAPGISVASASDLSRMDYAAGRVAFLVDGDDAGEAWKKSLATAEVPAKRIRSLPSGTALEDLLDRTYYLESMADLLEIDMSELSDLDADGPIKGAFEKWAANRKKKLPGAVAVTEFMLGQHESGQRLIRLGSGKARVLKSVNDWAIKQLEVR